MRAASPGEGLRVPGSVRPRGGRVGSALPERRRDRCPRGDGGCRGAGRSLGDGREIRLEQGDEIRTEISRKFTRESFVKELEGTGLELSAWFTDSDSLFASALVRPVSV